MQQAQNRFMEGVWQEVRFAGRDPVPGHFLHVSQDDPSKVAFYPDMGKLQRDICTRMKPGRYLGKYYPDLNEDQVRTLAEHYTARYASTLKFVENTDPDGWEAVYENAVGFSSCMMYNHPTDRYLAYGLYGFEHPVRAYARKGNGLRLAYLGPEDRSAIYARAIVRDYPDGSPQGFIRVYGDSSIKAQMAAAGYADETDLSEVRLNLVWADIEGNDVPVCPYLDGDVDRVDLEDACLVVRRWGTYSSNSSGFLAEYEQKWVCPSCGAEHDSDDEQESAWEGDTLCSACTSGYSWAVYDRYGSHGWVPNDDVIEIDGGMYRDDPEVLAAHNIDQCTACGEYQDEEGMTSTSRGLICRCTDLEDLATPDRFGNDHAHPHDVREAIDRNGNSVLIHDDTDFDDDFRDPDEDEDEEITVLPEPPAVVELTI